MENNALSEEEISSKSKHIIDQLHTGLNEAEKLQITENFKRLAETVVAWAHNNEHEIHSVKRLGGGFKNPVILLTTAKGEQFVAKAFVEASDLHTTTTAREKLDTLFSDDEKIIPKSEIFEDTLFSEKAKGEPVKQLIEEAVKNPEQTARAIEAFRTVGATLGMIHERTERPIHQKDSLPDDIAMSVLMDRDKALLHMDDLNIAKLTGIDQSTVDLIKRRMAELTEPNFVSLIHSDAHLDQFFHEEGGAVAEIVDYDSIREGDPMADLGRLVASLRDWSKRFGASRELETELTRAIAQGYESVRDEDHLISGESELDVMRLVAYEIRLHLIKLKSYSGLRKELEIVATELGLEEYQILNARGDQAQIIESHLNETQIQKLSELRTVAEELSDIINYLPHGSDEVKSVSRV